MGRKLSVNKARGAAQAHCRQRQCGISQLGYDQGPSGQAWVSFANVPLWVWLTPQLRVSVPIRKDLLAWFGRLPLP